MSTVQVVLVVPAVQVVPLPTVKSRPSVPKANALTEPKVVEKFTVNGRV
jgi:hypothetical protein